VVRHHPGRFEVLALAAHSNVNLLEQQVREFKPRYAVVANVDAVDKMPDLGPDVTVLTGPQGLVEAAALDVDTALCAVVGAAGLYPVLEAIDAAKQVAIANKEPLVMAGPAIMERARQKGTRILPVDSEHNAIFQCLQGHAIEDVACIHITASGGPFYGRRREDLKTVTPEQATRHPTWDMGAKISVDSATLMNKGLEVIEAMWLFGLPLDQINVLIHPQSVIHSLVEFRDGSILAHLGVTDMKLPIQFALTWPDRVEPPLKRLDLTRLSNLSFAAPDFADFPCLAYALEAARTGGTAPAILNAANEVAVSAFCDHQIPFLGISDFVRQVMDKCPATADTTIEAVVDADAAARRCARDCIEKSGAHV